MDNFVKNIMVPDTDCDVVLVFPSGNVIEIQSRPSNGDGGNYNGSLDIILPFETSVVCWEGDDMKPAQANCPNRPQERFAKHLYTKIP